MDSETPLPFSLETAPSPIFKKFWIRLGGGQLLNAEEFRMEKGSGRQGKRGEDVVEKDVEVRDNRGREVVEKWADERHPLSTPS